MHIFVLADLHTQAEMLPPEIRTWSLTHFLSWLRLYGTVVELDPRFDYPEGTRLYHFEAPSGLETVFTLTQSGRFTIRHPRFRDVWSGIEP
jgi:hypothetical protein